MDFNQIYQQHANLVFNLALNYANNVEDAEEITQDVFVKVHDHFHEFKNNAELKTWIYRIAINQSLDFIKSKKRKKRSFLSNLLGFDQMTEADKATDFHHPGVELENSEAIRELLSKIDQLPENQKTVIILLKIEDLSQKEVSDILQISDGAVESLLQRAKNNLKKML